MVVAHAIMYQKINHLGLLVVNSIRNRRNSLFPDIKLSLEFTKCDEVNLVENALLHVGAPAISGNATDTSLEVSMVFTSEHIEHAVHDSGLLHLKFLLFVSEGVKLPDCEVVINL